MYFEIIGKIEDVEEIAVGGKIRKTELHWYEAHGIGRKKIKIKGFFD